MEYLLDPLHFCAVTAPNPAEEENLDWKEGIHAFQSAILDLSDEKKVKVNDNKYNYRTEANVAKDFPAYERACTILETFHKKVLTGDLNNSTIDYPPMNIKPIKEKMMKNI